MKLPQIKAYLDSPDPQSRMKAITELRHYEPNLVVPLLKRRMYDQEFVVRSFVAMGLGYKQTDEGFDLLLDLIKNDRDYGVRAEAASSLAKYGEAAVPYLVNLFRLDSNWLIRYSIYAVIDFEKHPDLLFEFFTLAFQEDNLVIQQTAIASLEQLAKTSQEIEALELLLSVVNSEQGAVRAQVARVLRHFDDPKAEAALMGLRQDRDYQVVGATLEGLI